MRSLVRSLRTLGERLIPSGSVTERAIQSGAWATLSNVLGRGLQLAKLVVLANLLTPEEFGLVGIALLTLAAVRRVTKLGLDEALIQRPESDVDGYLDTAWVLRSGRGIAIAAVVAAGAPVVARVFDVPGATDVVRVMALVPILLGVQNPGIVYFRKALDFHREFVYRVGGALADASVAIVAALVLGNVWALVYGALAGAVARLALSYLVHGYRPGIAFDRNRARDLLGFGKWITLSGALVFLINEGDDAFVGWFLDAGALGLYRVAYRFSNAPATEITHVISGVIFPTYAQLQDEADSLRRAYFRTLQLTTFVAVPASVGIAVVAPTFVPAILGSAWTSAVPVMQLLAAWGLARALGATTGPLFRAVGRPDYETKIQLGKLVVIATLIYPATAAYGIVGTAAVIVGNAVLFSEPVATYLAVRTVDGRYGRFLRLLAYPTAGSAVMALCVVAVRRAILSGPSVPGFLLLVGTGVVTYALAMFAVESLSDYDIATVLRSIRGSLA